jgi:hypothetical protein
MVATAPLKLEGTIMRLLCFLFLVLFLAAIGLFAYYNQQDMTLEIFNWSITASVAAVIGVAYLLGMLSGWSVWGMLRRSLREVSTYAQEHLTAARH